jgi:hypothetical protein
VLGTLAALLAMVGLSGCFGDDRSVAAVCQVWDTDGKALHNQLAGVGANARQNLFGGLAQLAGAPGAVGDLMAKMAAVAPSDVAPSFQSLADDFHSMGLSQGAAVSDPLAGLANGLAGAFTSQAAVNDVNRFLAQNCGVPSS